MTRISMKTIRQLNEKDLKSKIQNQEVSLQNSRLMHQKEHYEKKVGN